jgi:hypothetical protein
LAQQLLAKHNTCEQIVLGDFNLHHPYWGGPAVRDIEPEAEELLQLAEHYGLTITTPPGTITYKEGNARTSIDLCWITQGLVDRLIRSGVNEDLDHDSDHLPIGTQLDLRVAVRGIRWVRNWRKLDEKQFRTTLEKNLPPIRRPRTKRALDEYAKEIVYAMQQTANKVLPCTKPSPKAKEGWRPRIFQTFDLLSINTQRNLSC